MDIWSILDLKQTTDLKVIKSAYAKKLKITRPDDKPEEFQILHSAYKQALHWAKISRKAPESQLDWETGVETITQVPVEEYIDSSSTEELNPSQEIMQNENPLIENIEQESLVDPLAQVKSDLVSLLANKERRNNPLEWQFITHNPDLLDWQVADQLSAFIVPKLVQKTMETRRSGRHKRLRSKVNIRVLVSTPILEILNQVFEWSHHPQNIYHVLEQSSAEYFLTTLSSFEHSNVEGTIGIKGGAKIIEKANVLSDTQVILRKNVQFGNDVYRLLAFFVDQFLVSYLTAFILGTEFLKKKLSINLNGDKFLLIIILVTVIYSWLMECSRHQATIGMKLFRLKVYSKKGTRISYWQGLLRNVLFGASIVGNFVIALINYMLTHHRYLHDRLSGTYVLNYADIKRKKAFS
ncbi:RDD family protein [Pleionea sediminis]|uniref:RDD family protein n=1 Tax=Pleionea sediminis TaxID=2569479 RepID=UPI001185FD50|nr:RDD family protein [Pleionea sediminis]